MSLRESLVKLEGRWSWSFFGFLLAIVLGGVTIYNVYFEDKSPNLQFLVESKSTVLDLKKDIKNLDILYKGININEQDKNLSIIKVKVINNSNVSILKTYYDDLSPILLSVKNANIVDKPIVIGTSNNYLKKNLHLKLDSTGSIFLPPLILDGSEHYTISLLLLHKNGIEPTINPSGKVAGQADDLEVIKVYETDSEKNFWQKLIEGNFWVHLVRYIGYTIIVILTVVAVIIPSEWISDKVKKRRKRKRVEKYKKKKNVKNSPESDSIFALYLRHDVSLLFEIQKLLINENRFNNAALGYFERLSKDEVNSRPGIDDFESKMDGDAQKTVTRTTNFDSLIFVLDKDNMINESNGKYSINSKFKKELAEFISYLKLI